MMAAHAIGPGGAFMMAPAGHLGAHPQALQMIQSGAMGQMGLVSSAPMGSMGAVERMGMGSPHGLQHGGPPGGGPKVVYYAAHPDAYGQPHMMAMGHMSGGMPSPTGMQYGMDPRAMSQAQQQQMRMMAGQAGAMHMMAPPQ